MRPFLSVSILAVLPSGASAGGRWSRRLPLSAGCSSVLTCGYCTPADLLSLRTGLFENEHYPTVVGAELGQREIAWGLRATGDGPPHSFQQRFVLPAENLARRRAIGVQNAQAGTLQQPSYRSGMGLDLPPAHAPVVTLPVDPLAFPDRLRPRVGDVNRIRDPGTRRTAWIGE
ncbi:hypothetical protein [Actinoplanes subglobosus]|uniref:Uncharacterized protein n=1 Tax=Actinoplanes subglobosus TaxID=1547892 RepID=A0ABV8J0V5_9ACTN